MTEPITITDPQVSAAGVLELARRSRERISRQLGQIQAARPSGGAGPIAQARWLQDKADVHDRIAGYLRDLGDIPGAVEAEVLASRCRIDARDLTHTASTAEAGGREDAACLDGPCPPVRPAAARPPATAATCRGVSAIPEHAQARSRDVRDQGDVLVTCGPGLP